MDYEALFPRGRRPIRTALTGAGAFGRSLVAQSRRIDNLDVRVVCDSDPGAARDAWRVDPRMQDLGGPSLASSLSSGSKRRGFGAPQTPAERRANLRNKTGGEGGIRTLDRG